MSREKGNAFIVMTVGALITALCGTCTFSATQQPDGLAGLAMIIGGASTLVGLVLLIWGVRLWRGLKPPSDREGPR